MDIMQDTFITGTKSKLGSSVCNTNVAFSISVAS